MRAWWMLPLFLGGCGAETSSEPAWPKRVTITTQGAMGGDGVRLADGAIVAGGGDLRLYQAMVLSLRTPAADSLCEKGTFASLEEIPTAIDACPEAYGGAWGQHAYLSASTTHTSEESYVIGLGLLVRDEDHTVVYRLRIVGDSYDIQGRSTATFDYEPVP